MVWDDEVQTKRQQTLPVFPVQDLKDPFQWNKIEKRGASQDCPQTDGTMSCLSCILTAT